ncbi:hypothetical protein PHSC3_001586 [Chlamydiales bacterium STE3]|nr:hypothetical protein PHSC3_001586 [Chlamydiales bacterium STE3]
MSFNSPVNKILYFHRNISSNIEQDHTFLEKNFLMPPNSYASVERKPPHLYHMNIKILWISIRSETLAIFKEKIQTLLATFQLRSKILLCLKALGKRQKISPKLGSIIINLLSIIQRN